VNRLPAFGGIAAPAGAVDARVVRDLGSLTVERRASLWWRFKNYIQHKHRGTLPYVAALLVGRLFGVVTLRSELLVKLVRANGDVIDFGLVSRRVVTDVGMGFVVDAFQNLVELENMKYHGLGTGGTAEAASQTALVTELTTEYASDNNRPAGTTTEQSQKVYETVGTNTVDGAAAVTEHGIFDQAANSGGVLLDRSLFSVINLASGDSLVTTYRLTFNSGG
jgi:hypothetical protein